LPLVACKEKDEISDSICYPKSNRKEMPMLPIPKFLCPGKAIQEENDSSSSSEIQSLFSGGFFFVNLIHSVPGVA
jgi:hypothetical protein